MRVLTICAVALCGAAQALSAQHAHNFELGLFGQYTRFDPYWNLKDGVGWGGRFGYFLNDYFGIEVSGGQTTATPKAGAPTTATTPVRPGDINLILNSGGEHNILYVLGGYSRLSMGSASPYAIGLNAVHGAIGDRIFFNDFLALRLEAGVYYAPTSPGTTTHPLNYVGNAGLSIVMGNHGHKTEQAPEIPKETRDSILAAGGTLPQETSNKRFVESGAGWAQQWFWGGQGGVMVMNTDEGVSAEPVLGGHWLITRKRTAMYVAFEQVFSLNDRHATIVHPDGTVEPSNIAFKDIRRIMAGIVAYPVQKPVQPFGGAGFSIMEILHPAVTCTGCTASDQQILEQATFSAATKAFFWLMGGIEARQGRLTLYGHYILQSGASGYLISGVTHTIQGGLRYSFGSSREDITEQH